MAAYIALPQIDPTVIKPLPLSERTDPAYGDKRSGIISETSTLPAALSPTVIEGMLRRDLNFNGLIVTDALNMSGLTLYFNQGEAAVRAVEAGADMLIRPSDPDATFRGLRQAVQAGRISEKRLDQSVLRILATKYDLGLVQQRFTSIEQVDRLLSNRNVNALAQEISESAVTLVRNDAGLLPLNKLKLNARVFNLAITNGDDRLSIAESFILAMRRGGKPVDTLVLDERSSEEEARQVIESAQKADITIVSLYGRVRSGEARSVGLPKVGARTLAALIGQRIPLIAISFGNPYLLLEFPQLSTYIVAYGDMPSLQTAAARALLGEISFTGRLPISLSSLYPRGTGILLRGREQERKREKTQR